MPTSRQDAKVGRAARYLSVATIAIVMFSVLAAPISAASAPSAAAVESPNASARKTVSGAAPEAATGTPETVIDDGGPDDVPGQKDLSFMTVTYLGSTINVKWGWDDTATSGANTREGCALFDTSGDGLANYAFCISVASNGTATTTLVSCGNTSPSRCTNPVAVPPPTTSGATVSIVPGSDPFKDDLAHKKQNVCALETACHTDDAVADVTIVLSDFGGASASLVNVCSYPSGLGSAPGECVVAPDSGFLTIVKVATPSDGTPFLFNASAASTNGANHWTINGSGSQALIPYAATTTLDLNEVVPLTWRLDAHSCVIQNSASAATGTSTATGVDNLTIQRGIETVCTFNDSPADGTLTLVKVVDNLGQSGPGYKTAADFPLRIDGNAATTGTPVTLRPGSHTIAEISQQGYGVGTWTCSNGATGTPGSVSATVSVAPAANVTCSITNTLIPTPALTIEKSVTSLGPYKAVGDVILYAIKVTNTGNVTLTGVTVTDPGAGVRLGGALRSIGPCTPAIPATLAPGATIECVATHAVTQADIDLGHYSNTAFADSNQTEPVSASATVPVEQIAALTVLKTATSSGPYDSVGDVVTYSISVKNTGNLSLTGVTVSDPGVGAVLGACTPAIPAPLAPGASIVCVATHSITQSDIDAGSYTNTAVGDSDMTPPSSDTETVPTAQAAHITLEKSAVGARFARVADVINYTLVATNDGNVTLSNVTIVDPKLGTLACTPPQPVTLPPGATLSCTGSYTVTQTDLDAGVVTNVATATGTPPSGPNVSDTDDASVPSTQAPHISLVKSAVETTVDQVGDVIHYSLVATNDGNLTLSNVTIVDPKLGTLACTQPVTLAPGASLSCTGTHTVTQADLDAGVVNNVATVTAKPPLVPAISATDDASVAVVRNPALNVTKTVTSAGPYQATGNVISYAIRVTNTGNQTLTGVTVTDAGAGVVLGTCTPATPATVAPNASVVCAATHTVTQADIDAGTYTNTATGDSDQTPSDSATAIVPITQKPALAVTKTPTSAGPYDAVGQVITYSITVSNTGNQTLTGVAVTEAGVGAVLGACTPAIPATLAPGASQVCDATHSVTQADIDAGHYTNIAVGDSSQTAPAGATATVPTSQRPVLDVLKVITSGGPYDSVGDVITYSITATNTGNQTLTGVTITDPGAGVVLGPCTPLAPATLAPGASLSCVATHAVTQLDIDAGQYTNVGVGDSNESAPDSDSETAPITQTPGLNVLKTETSLRPYQSVGQVVSYSITVTNTGNQTLTGVTVSDPGVGAVLGPCTPAIPATLAPGKSVVCTATHSVTQADLDAGEYTNTANAVSDQTPPDSDVANVPMLASPALALVKSATPSTYDAVGQVITYTYTLTNTGNVTLPGPFSVTDDKLATVTCPATASLAPATSITCTASHTITQADIDAGSVVNVASASNGPVTSPPETETVTAIQTEALTIKKSSLTTSLSAPRTVNYSYLVTNTGNVTLTGIGLVDDNDNDDLACPGTTLAPAASMTCTATHTFTQAELDANGSPTAGNGFLTNTVTGSSNEAPSAIDTLSIPIVQTRALALVKSASPLTYDAPGQVISYGYVVTNTGNVTLPGPFSVSDDKAIDESCPATATLAPGASITCTASYTITQADIDAGSVVNVASATNGSVTSPSDTATVTAAQAASLRVEKSSATSSLSAPTSVTYSYLVTNTGNTTLSAISLSDDNDNDDLACPGTSLAPAASMTCTATHTFTQAELDANGSPTAGSGFVRNTVTASSNEAPATADTLSIPIVRSPALTIEKSASPATYDHVGQVISYGYLVTNTGNVTLAGPFSIADDKSADEACPSTATLAPGASITCTATYTVSQADLDAGSVVNTASATNGTTTSPTDSKTVTAAQAPALSIEKTSVDTTYTKVGDVLDYTYLVTNSGNVTLTGPFSVGDDKATDEACPATATLAPGASITCTATYTVAQTDLDAGDVTNTASASNGTTTSATDTLTIAATQTPSLTLDKTITSGDPYSTVGGTITYSYLVTNTGNVTITDLAVSDDKVDTTPVCDVTTLAPTETTTCTAVHTVTQADLDAGTLTNNATADGTPAGGTLTPATDSATATATQTPALTLDKTITSGDPYTTVGGTITYSYLVTNTGNVTITDLAVSDDKVDTVPVCDVTTLAPAETTTCTAVHTVTQADLDAGTLTNNASANGTPAGGTLSPATDTATATATQGAALTIDKSSSATEVMSAGQLVPYQYVVTNTGNVTLTGIELTDDNIDGTVFCPATTLAPAASMTCTAVHTVTQAEVDAGGRLTNVVDAVTDQGASATDTLSIAATQTPSLTLEKTITSGDPYTAVDGTIAYSYLVTNTGNVTITDLAISDDNVDATAVCDKTTLAPTETATCTAVHSVTQADLDAGSVTNDATANGTPAGGTLSPAPDSATATGTQTPALTLAKSANPVTYAAVGEAITYTYLVTNTGNVTFSGPVTVSDDKATVTCPAGGLDPGANTTCTATYSITAADISAGSVTNLATAHANGTDSNESVATVTVDLVADLAVTKTDGSLAYTPGMPVTYTITVMNAGPSDAIGATVTDALPPEVTSAAWTATGTAGTAFTESGTGGLDETVTIPAGGSITYTVVAQTSSAATGDLINTATVTPPVDTTDPVLANDSATDTDTAILSADLSITKSDGVTSVVAGDGVTHTYTITVTNAGPSDATAVTLVDTFPSGFSQGAITPSQGTCTAGVPFSCDLGTIAAGGSATVTIAYTVPASTTDSPQVNTVSVTSAVPDPDTANDTATDSDTVTANADVADVKADSPDPVIAGETLTYTITVTNAGPSDATSVSLTDSLPTGLSGATYTLDGVPQGAWTGTVALGTMVPGAVHTVVITATVDPNVAPGTVLVNTATVSSATTDPNLANNDATAPTTVGVEADLAVTKTDGVTTVVAGSSTGTYTITVTNAGPSDATSVTVTDTFPAGFSRGTVTPSQGTCTGSPSFTCDLGTIPAGGSATVTIAYAVPAATTGAQTNTATVASTVPDPVPGNNTATDTNDVTSVGDLSITKTDGATSVVAGTNATYTITVINGGPSSVTAAAVADPLPAGVTFVSATGGATYDAGTNTVNYTTGTIAVGGTESFTITVAVSPNATGSLTNTATVSPPAGTTDPAPGDNTATDTDTIASVADLAVAKTDGSSTYTPGTPVTYTITVTNGGPSTVHSLVLTDSVPAGLLNPVFGSPSSGSYDPATGIWSGLDLATGQSVTITLSGTADPAATGNLVNTTTVAPPAGTTDSVPGNNTATDTDTPNPLADLAVTKTDGASTYTPGSTVTYTITITNSGPSNVVAAAVSDVVPAGLTGVTWTSSTTGSASVTSGATGSGNTITATVDIAAGAGNAVIFTVTGTAQASLTGNLTNTATIIPPAGTTDPVPGNNTATDTDTPSSSADVADVKVDSIDPVVAGTNLSYTITVTNAGPSDAANVVVTDALDPALLSPTYTVEIDGGGPSAAAPWTGSVDVGSLAPGSTAVVVITGAVDPATPAGTILSNTATVASSTTDPNPANNTDTEQTTVDAVADLAVTKTDGVAIVTSGVSSGTYVITITNAGPSDATSVTLTDTFPSGFTAGTVTPSQGTCTAGPVFDCTLGTIAAGGSATVTIEYTVPAGTSGPQTNTATVGSAVTDPNPADNTATDTNAVDVLPAVAVDKTASPATVTEPGGPVTFTVTITNGSPEPVVLTGLVDDVHGDLNGQGTCVADGSVVIDPGAPYTCVFTADVTGNSGDTETDTITATVRDAEQNETTGMDSAVVAVVNVDPVVSVVKTASPLSRREPGGTFTFSVTVHNGSFEPVTLIGLVDDVYGNLAGQGTCVTGGTIAPGAEYTCSFPGAFTGDAGAAQTDMITATVEDDDEARASATDDATVTITNEPPTVIAGKTVSPTTANVGDIVTFTFTVHNTSAESVTLTALTDSVYGNLNGRGTCATGGSIAAGATYTCAFQAVVTETETDTVTAHVVDNEQSTASDTDSATVTVREADVTIAKQADADPVAAGAPIGFTVTVRNDGAGIARSVTVSDTLPTDAGLAWVLDDDAGGACHLAGGIVTCAAADLAPGASFDFHVTSPTTFATADTSPVTNEACFTTTNAGRACASDAVVVPQPVRSLTLTKTSDAPIKTLLFPDGTTADLATVSEGDTIGYTLTWQVSAAPVRSVVLTDVVPAGLAYVEGSATGSGDGEVVFAGYDPSTHTLTWTAAEITTSGSVRYRVIVMANASDAPQPITNGAMITSGETAPDETTADVYVVPPTGETSPPPTEGIVAPQAAFVPGPGPELALVGLAILMLAVAFIIPAPGRGRRRKG